MKAFIAIFMFITVITQAASARNWDRYEIPGAVCGDGLPYSVFVNKKANTNNLFIEFMGGGACWDFATCYGVNEQLQFNLTTWMHPMPNVPFFSYVTSDIIFFDDHPFSQDSAIYLPYCTGDVFSANHTANYSGAAAHHVGYDNVIKTFQFLAKRNILNFGQVQRLSVYGASAGAIGALVHLKNIEPYFPKAKKIGLIDSAGLHFGKTFWNKFTPQLVGDFTKAFLGAGLVLNPNDGFIAQHLGPVFANLPKWNVGIMQATRDGVMSSGFGDISPEDHRRLVLSNRGIAAVAKNYSNVSVWINDSTQHTFMLLPDTARLESMNGVQALDFVTQVVNKPAPK